MRRSRTGVIVAAVAGLLLAGGTVAVAASDPVPVDCTITENVLSCPLPEPPAPVTETATVTETAAPVTVTAPPVTVTVTAEPTTSAPATTTASPEPTTTAAPPPTTTTTAAPPPAGGFPTAANTGVPAGWVPTVTRGSLTVTQAGAVIEDMRINGDLTIAAANVTVRRVEVIGGQIANWPGSTCFNGLVLEDVSVVKTGTSRATDPEAVGTGGYTARRVKLDGVPEGFRVGGKPGCGPVTIENSYARIVSPDVCGDWHGDGVQGYGGAALTVRNLRIDFTERNGCGGTAPFFVPHNQGNTSVDIDGLLVKGGGYSFRSGTPGPVRNLNIVQGSWGYGPVDVRCSVVSSWDAYRVTLDANGQPINRVVQGCTGTGT